jgi:hypothetical protein
MAMVHLIIFDDPDCFEKTSSCLVVLIFERYMNLDESTITIISAPGSYECPSTPQMEVPFVAVHWYLHTTVCLPLARLLV